MQLGITSRAPTSGCLSCQPQVNPKSNPSHTFRPVPHTPADTHITTLNTHLSVASAWKGMCGWFAQGAAGSVWSEGTGMQLITGPTSFTRSLRRLRAQPDMSAGNEVQHRSVKEDGRHAADHRSQQLCAITEAAAGSCGQSYASLGILAPELICSAGI